MPNPIIYDASSETGSLTTTAGGGGSGGLNAIISAIDAATVNGQPVQTYVINLTGQINLTSDLLAISRRQVLSPSSRIAICARSSRPTCSA